MSSRISLLFSTFRSLPGPAAEKHPHIMMLHDGVACLQTCLVFGASIESDARKTLS